MSDDPGWTRIAVRSIVSLAALLLCAGGALAHPGVGIVRMKAGVVYYTDLARVLRIGPDGKTSVAVDRVHTHELYLDADENLFGEHLWYEGDATKKWGHRVWRLGTDGALTDVVPAREGFRSDFSFVRDAKGSRFFSDEKQNLLRKRGDAAAETVASGFEDIRWMTAAPEGTVFLVDGRHLMRVAPGGAVTALAKDLTAKRWGLDRSDRHLLMGVWLDTAGNAYVAANADRAVRKVTPSGSVSVVAKTAYPWAPSGGLTTAQGDLWILECDTFNRVRVRRIEKGGKVTVFARPIRP